MRVILGLNVWSHDTSACLIRDGKVLGAIEQERINLQKHTKEFPLEAVEVLLNRNRLTMSEVDCVAVGWNFERFIRSHYLLPALENFEEISYLIRDVQRISDFHETERLIKQKLNYSGTVRFFDHHLCHAAMSFAATKEEQTTSIVIDGYGDCETTSIFSSSLEGHQLLWGKKFPDSLGLVYSAVTQFLGFQPNCDEGIVMGLAAYGNGNNINPKTLKTYRESFSELIVSDDNDVFKVNREFFPFGNSRVGLYARPMEGLCGSPRQPGESITQHHKDIANALQTRLQEVLLDLLLYAYKLAPTKTLTLSGGVALNCVANSYLLERGPFERVFVPCNPGDGGVAIGAAILASNKSVKMSQDDWIGLGPVYPDTDYASAVACSRYVATHSKNISLEAAKLLKEGKILAWYQDGSEFGPRALGNRSIITAPFPKGMKDFVNSRVKFREEFRPFAPIVLEENADRYFYNLCYTPYMMHAFRVRPEYSDQIPAVVHYDGTARVQTVSRIGRPKLANLLDAFESLSGVAVLLNTSFNVKGQPIVETPIQAVKTFESTNIDALVIGDYIINKEKEKI